MCVTRCGGCDIMRTLRVISVPTGFILPLNVFFMIILNCSKGISTPNQMPWKATTGSVTWAMSGTKLSSPHAQGAAEIPQNLCSALWKQREWRRSPAKSKVLRGHIYTLAPKLTQRTWSSHILRCPSVAPFFFIRKKMFETRGSLMSLRRQIICFDHFCRFLFYFLLRPLFSFHVFKFSISFCAPFPPSSTWREKLSGLTLRD